MRGASREGGIKTAGKQPPRFESTKGAGTALAMAVVQGEGPAGAQMASMAKTPRVLGSCVRELAQAESAPGPEACARTNEVAKLEGFTAAARVAGAGYAFFAWPRPYARSLVGTAAAGRTCLRTRCRTATYAPYGAAIFSYARHVARRLLARALQILRRVPVPKPWAAVRRGALEGAGGASWLSGVSELGRASGQRGPGVTGEKGGASGRDDDARGREGENTWDGETGTSR